MCQQKLGVLIRALAHTTVSVVVDNAQVTVVGSELTVEAGQTLRSGGVVVHLVGGIGLDQGGEQADRAVVIVGDLEDATHLREVDVGSGVDLPPATTCIAEVAVRNDVVVVGVTVDPGQDVRVVPQQVDELIAAVPLAGAIHRRDEVVHRPRGVVAEQDEHLVGDLVVTAHTEVVVVGGAASPQHLLEPLPLHVVERTVGVASPVRGVHRNAGDARSDLEGVVAAHGVEIVLGEAVTGSWGSGGGVVEVRLDELRRGEGAALGIRGDVLGERDGTVGEVNLLATLGGREEGLLVALVGEAHELLVTGVHGLQQAPVGGQGALDRVVVVAEDGVPRNLEARGAERLHDALEVAVHLGVAGLLVHVVDAGLGVVVQLVAKGLDGLPALLGATIGGQGAAGENGEVPLELNGLVVVGVVTGAHDHVELATGERSTGQGVDATHQGGGAQRAEGLLGAEGRSGKGMHELHSHRRLDVGDVQVGDLHEAGQCGTTIVASALGRDHVLTHAQRETLVGDNALVAVIARRQANLLEGGAGNAVSTLCGMTGDHIGTQESCSRNQGGTAEETTSADVGVGEVGVRTILGHVRQGSDCPSIRGKPHPSSDSRCHGAHERHHRHRDSA